jgi:hypothetical protein
MPSSKANANTTIWGTQPVMQPGIQLADHVAPGQLMPHHEKLDAQNRSSPLAHGIGPPTCPAKTHRKRGETHGGEGDNEAGEVRQVLGIGVQLAVAAHPAPKTT